MSTLEVLLSGFVSFFSIWQVCMLQISPFFMVYLIGLFATSLVMPHQHHRLLGWTLLPVVAYLIGFGVMFALLSASGLYIGRYLNYHITELRLGAGIFFLIIAGWFFLAERVAWLSNRLGTWLAVVMTWGVGIALALIYSPCITPTLSEILGLAVRGETARHGAWLALFYGLGMSLAFGLVGLLLVIWLRSRCSFMQHIKLIKNLAAGVMLILALMNITGIMTYYKAFFLGLLVR